MRSLSDGHTVEWLTVYVCSCDSNSLRSRNLCSQPGPKALALSCWRSAKTSSATTMTRMHHRSACKSVSRTAKPSQRCETVLRLHPIAIAWQVYVRKTICLFAQGYCVVSRIRAQCGNERCLLGAANPARDSLATQLWKVACSSVLIRGRARPFEIEENRTWRERFWHH